MNAFHYSDAGMAMTTSFEGLRLTAYPDSAGVWTIGYGHTGPAVHAGQTITQPEAEALLRADLADAVACVNRAVTAPIAQHHFDALVDFCFNAGRGSLLRSQLLRQVNAGDLAGAAAQFALWVHAGGAVVAGLVRRRRAEADLFAGAEADLSAAATAACPPKPAAACLQEQTELPSPPSAAAVAPLALGS